MKKRGFKMCGKKVKTAKNKENKKGRSKQIEEVKMLKTFFIAGIINKFYRKF